MVVEQETTMNAIGISHAVASRSKSGTLSTYRSEFHFS